MKRDLGAPCRLWAFTFAACAVLLCGCEPEQEGDPRVNLYLNWILTGSYAGEAVAAQILDAGAGIDLNIMPGGQGLDPLKLVGDGDIGIASADEIVRAIDRGLKIKILGCANDDSPAAFVSLKRSGILAPADLPGKRVGLLPFGSTGLVYQALLEVNGVDRQAITEIIVGPDLRAFLTANTHDVHPVFVYDETVTLDDQGVAYNLIEPRAWGVRFKGPCYFATQQTIDRAPEMLSKAIPMLAEGWRTALEDPEQAINQLLALDPSLSKDRERKVLLRGAPYFHSDTRAPLETDPATWPEFLEMLQRYGVTRSVLAADQVLDLSFLAKRPLP